MKTSKNNFFDKIIPLTTFTEARQYMIAKGILNDNFFLRDNNKRGLAFINLAGGEAGP